MAFSVSFRACYFLALVLVVTAANQTTTTSGSCRSLPLRWIMFFALLLVAVASNTTNETKTDTVADGEADTTSGGNTSGNGSVATASGSCQIVHWMATGAAMFGVASAMVK